MNKIQEWTDDETQSWFEKIEKDKGKGEWFEIEWKENLCFEDTGLSHNNTSQKAISGFANTYGGILIIGFGNNGEAKGFKDIPNVENHLSEKLKQKLQGDIPLFKSKTFIYKDKSFLIIFVAPSKKPIRCDNGAYYYREQSEFKPMTHEMLERKFRENFEEEKYLTLLKYELKRLIHYALDMSRKLTMPNGVSSHKTVANNVEIYSKILFDSGEKLYNYYKENNLLNQYEEFVKIVSFWIASNGSEEKHNNHFTTLWQQSTDFLRDLESREELK